MGKDYTKILNILSNRINDITQENSRIEWQIATISKKMKKDFGCSKLKEAKTYATKLNGEISKMEAEVESEIYEIKEIMDGIEE